MKPKLSSLSLSKLLLCLLVFILAPVTLCYGDVIRYLYDHGLNSRFAAYPVPNVWLEDEPTNCYVAAIVYTGDGQMPDNYFKEVNILTTSIGKDGGVDGGNWYDVPYWKVFIFDMGDRKEMHNPFSVRALAAGGPNVMVKIMRRPTNIFWWLPYHRHPTTGQSAYYMGFDVWDQHWKAIKNHVYAMGAVPVFRGRQKDMPFLPLIWTSYGMNLTNLSGSHALGSGTCHGLYATPDVPGEDMPLNVDGDPVGLFLYNHYLPWGHGTPFFMGAVVDQDNSPTFGPEELRTRLVSWSPTNLVLETVATQPQYDHGIAVESTTDLVRGRWLDVARTGPTFHPPNGSNYQFSVPIPPGTTQRFFHIRNCDYTGWPLLEPGYPGVSSSASTNFPAATNFAIPTPVRPTNVLYSRYTGPSTPPGLAVPASQGLSIAPKVPLPQALASVRYSPDEAQTALAQSAVKSAFMASPDPGADGWEVAFDHEDRVVQWRSKAAPTTTANASLKSVSPSQLRASDPVGFYAPHASAERFIAQFGNLFVGTNPESGFRAQIAERDGLGITHVRYRQHLEGVSVFGAEVVVHVNAAGKVTTANGLAVQNPAVSVIPMEAIENARETALNLWRKQPGSRSGGQVVLEELEVFCPRLFLCDSTPEFSEADVVDAPPPPNGLETDAVPGQLTGWVNLDYLTWRIRVAGEPGEPDLTYFVDAHSGKPRWVISNRMRLTNRQIYDVHQGTSYWEGTLARAEGQPPSGIPDVDAAYDCFGQLNDWLRTVFGRDGANGMGGLNLGDGGLKVYVNFAAAYFAPVLGGSQFWYSDYETRIETTHEWIDLKSFAHEYVHGLEYFTHPPSGMTYQNQTGALMESTCNILAECFQNYLTGTNDWTIWLTNYPHGSNEYLQGFQVVMNDPWLDASIYGAYADPKNLYGRDYYCGSTAVDNGGVHANSYPISYAAYLLTRGGYFNNCTINAIGLEAVGAIWYRANGYYSASANFAEAFLDLQQAAADLYPSNVVAEVRKALQAVEMDQPGRCDTTTPRRKPEPASTTCSAPDFDNPAVLGKCYFYEHELWDFIMPMNIMIKFGSDGKNPASMTYKYYIVPDK